MESRGGSGPKNLIVISNTSPVVALDYLSDLDLLQKLFPTGILVPGAVKRELAPRELPPWVQPRSVQQSVGFQVLNASLGAGESEAIALALELRADLVLLDDKAARRLALALGLVPVGTAGLLLKAKSLGFITAIRPKLDALLKLPFHISPRLYQAVVRDAGE